MSGHIPLMDEDGQRLYLNSMLSSPELFARVSGLVSPKYFDPDLAKGVKFLQNYFADHRTVPAANVFTAATKLSTEVFTLGKADIDYVSQQIAEFCKFQAVIQVVKDAAGDGGMIERGDFSTMISKMKSAVEIGLTTDLGINYFDNPQARLDSADDDPPVISTGWSTVDAIIGGGIGRQELVLFLAPSGGGKSVAMLNLAFNLMSQGLHGVYISLEMRDKKVATRTDQLIAKMTSGMVDLNRTEAADSISKFHERTGAKFFIKRMRESTTCANDIIAYLHQLEASQGFKPDFVVVDYLDIMAPNSKNIDTDSTFLREKFIAEEVRAIGHDFDCIMISASQLEKGATEKINNGQKMHQGNVQGGSSKTNTSDLQIALARTEAMMSSGEVRFDFPKARNSDANTKQVMMKWNSSLRISDFDTAGLEFVQKGAPGKALPVRGGASKLKLANVTPGVKEDTSLEALAAKFSGEKHE